MTLRAAAIHRGLSGGWRWAGWDSEVRFGFCKGHSGSPGQRSSDVARRVEVTVCCRRKVTLDQTTVVVMGIRKVGIFERCFGGKLGKVDGDMKLKDAYSLEEKL